MNAALHRFSQPAAFCFLLYQRERAGLGCMTPTGSPEPTGDRPLQDSPRDTATPGHYYRTKMRCVRPVFLPVPSCIPRLTVDRVFTTTCAPKMTQKTIPMIVETPTTTIGMISIIIRTIPTTRETPGTIVETPGMIVGMISLIVETPGTIIGTIPTIMEIISLTMETPPTMMEMIPIVVEIIFTTMEMIFRVIPATDLGVKMAGTVENGGVLPKTSKITTISPTRTTLASWG